jgi:hypothetical protein
VSGNNKSKLLVIGKKSLDHLRAPKWIETFLTIGSKTSGAQRLGHFCKTKAILLIDNAPSCQKCTEIR